MDDMKPEPFDIANALASTLDLLPVTIAGDTQAFVYDQEQWVFVDRHSIASPDDLRLASDICDVLLQEVSAVRYVLLNWIPLGQAASKASETDHVALTLGKTAVTANFAVRKLLDIPATFEKSQQNLIEEALSIVDPESETMV